MFKWFMFTLLGLLFLVVALPVFVLFSAISDQPIVDIAPALSAEDVRNIKILLKKNNPLDSRRQRQRHVELTQKEVNLLLGHGSQQLTQVTASVSFVAQFSVLSASYKLPNNPFGSYINIATQWRESENWLTLDGVKIGVLSLPTWLTNTIFVRAEQYAQRHYIEYQQLRQMLNSIQFFDKKIIVTYDWHPDIIQQWKAKGKDILLPESQRKRLVAYNNRLARFTYTVGWKRYGLERLLQPMFALAVKRVEQGEDAVEENRALLLTLGIYATGTNLVRHLRQDKGQHLLSPRFTRGTLVKRHDLLQHYLISAALAVAAGTRLADLVGLAKELDDSFDGSGFSFPDLLADRSGVRLAEFAVKDEATAKQVQKIMAEPSLKQADFMPSISKLPEGLTVTQFKKKYKDVDHNAFRQIEQEIESRIKSRDVFKQLQTAH